MARSTDWLQPGDHVIVTGGSSGIGLALAAEFAGRGSVVSLVARDRDQLSAAADSLRTAGATVHARSVDVSDPSRLAATIHELETTAGPCAVLVTSAGQCQPGYFPEMPDDVFRTMMEVNYFGTLWAVRAVAPQMARRGRGTVVTIVSTAGLIGMYGYTAYGPAKFAVRGLTESLRNELCPHGIRVAGVFPPDVDTPQLADEIQRRPAELNSIPGPAPKPLPPDTAAKWILRGLDQGRSSIYLDARTRALARWDGLITPLLRRYLDRRVRAAHHRTAEQATMTPTPE